MAMKNNYGLNDASRSQSALPYQEDEVRPLVVEGDRRTAERGVVRALRGRMPERLTRQLGVVQLLFKVCPRTHTHTHRRRSFNISVSEPLHVHKKHKSGADILFGQTRAKREFICCFPLCGISDQRFSRDPRRALPPAAHSVPLVPSIALLQYPTLSVPPRRLRPLSLRAL